jgi:predicted helicase
MTATIHYFTLQDEQRREEKLGWFRSTKLRDIDFQRVYPDAKGTWINQADNDFESLLPLVDKEVKAGKSGEAILTNYSLGIATNRDEWVYDLNSPLTLPRQGGGDLSASDTTRGDLSEPDITREDIFHYVYAVLHNPAYRKKYELNLKRDFPRIPFYDDFRQWAAWGKTLMELHRNDGALPAGAD